MGKKILVSFILSRLDIYITDWGSAEKQNNRESKNQHNSSSELEVVSYHCLFDNSK